MHQEIGPRGKLCSYLMGSFIHSANIHAVRHLQRVQKYTKKILALNGITVQGGVLGIRYIHRYGYKG